MKIEVKAVTYYTVELTESDIKKIKNKLYKDSSCCLCETDVSDAIFDLYNSGEISLYAEERCVESDFATEEIYQSEFEEQTWEEVFLNRQEE